MNDPDLDSDVAYAIEVTVDASSAGEYRPLDPDDVAVTNLDNEEPPPPEALHVGALSSTGSDVSKGKWNASVTITVHDATHGEFPPATVSGSWSNGATGSSECTTGALGDWTVTKNNI